MEDKAEGGRSLIESILNLIDLISIYVRQQTKRTVDQSITRPIGNAARSAAFLILSFSLFSIAAIFIAVGLFLLLAFLVGYILAYFIVGVLLVLAGFIFLRQTGIRKPPSQGQLEERSADRS
ncbi:MAG TPA: hypothetical protein VE439_02655 [Anaerolineae bacterium]|jgi:membrane-bound ClpP family serine protease|nr:hypothetical protein [Anaerolineae bacterium]